MNTSICSNKCLWIYCIYTNFGVGFSHEYYVQKKANENQLHANVILLPTTNHHEFYCQKSRHMFNFYCLAKVYVIYYIHIIISFSCLAIPPIWEEKLNILEKIQNTFQHPKKKKNSSLLLTQNNKFINIYI